jgi:hypothetical protein
MAPALYTASVPVFLHYLEQARGLVSRARNPALLKAKLAPDMFSGAEQFASVADFALRGTFPLVGAAAPALPSGPMDREGILARLDFARSEVEALEPSAFEDADTRLVRHRAGFAELEQSGAEYLHLFAMPNFLFHLGMGFAVLRAEGLDIGKSDFDGLHDYPPGFRF